MPLEGRQASAAFEVEITPRMLKAGLSEYASRDEILETHEETVSRIFRAMILARREDR